MPVAALIAVCVVTIGCLLFIANGVRTLRRRRRNLARWEKGDPLEDLGDWD